MEKTSTILGWTLMLAACGGDKSSITTRAATDGTFSGSSIPAQQIAWVSPGSASSSANLAWAACAMPEGSTVSIVEGFPFINEGTETLIQTLDLTGLLVTGLATSFESTVGDVELAVHGYNPITDTGEVRFYKSVSGVSDVLESAATVTLTLGVDLVPIAMSLGQDGFWWAATIDSLGELFVHRISDQDLDGIPDQQTVFANLTTLAVDYGPVTDNLEVAPIELAATDSSEVYIRQIASRTALRLVDSDADNIADMALFPQRREGPGSSVIDGAWPGSNKVLVQAFPDTAVQVHRIDVTGTPVELLASGVSGLTGEWVADLTRPLVAGDTIAVQNLDTLQVGFGSSVESSTAPAIMRTSSSEIPLGGTISLYMPNAIGVGVQVFWEYISEENFPTQTSQPCDLVGQIGAIREYVFPMPTDTPLGMAQVLKIVAEGETRPRYIDVKVRDLPEFPTFSYPELCSGDGGNQQGCTDCPCGNNAASGTVGGCLNSSGSSARLEASGNPSVSLPPDIVTDLRFGLLGAVPSSLAVLSSGDSVAPTNIANMCFGLDSGVQSVVFDGLRCAVESILRHGGRSADSSGDVGLTNNPWGGEGAPPAGIVAAIGSFTAGQTRYFQATYRDDVTLSCMRGINTSQAIEVMFVP